MLGRCLASIWLAGVAEEAAGQWVRVGIKIIS